MRWGIGILLGLVLLASAPTFADEDSARYFARRARDCLASGNLDEAEKQFRKALSEHPGFLPAMLGLAETALEREDKPGAVGILESLLTEAEKNRPGTEGKAVVEQAEKMLKKLDRPRYEYRRLLRKYVADLLALARRNEKDAPDLAGRCADRVVRLVPGHAEATAILERVGRPTSSLDEEAAPAAVAANEELLFDGKNLDRWEGITKRWKLENGILLGDLLDGAYFISHDKELKGNYTLVAEMRVKEPGKSPRIGMQFGFKGSDETFEFDIFPQSFSLGREKDGSKNKVRRADPFEVMSGFDQAKWNRYEVKVEGQVATMFVNGKKIFSYEVPDEPRVFDGYPGIIVQLCVAEIRKVSVIRE